MYTSIRIRWYFSALMGAILVVIWSLYQTEGSSIQRILNQLRLMVANQDGAVMAYLLLMITVLLAFTFYYLYTHQQNLHHQEKILFFSLAAHQLRTPLGAIRWNLEELLAGDEGPVSPEVRVLLKDIYKSNQHLVRLVNNLLLISRMHQGRKKFVFTQQFPKTVIAESVKLVAPIAKSKKVSIAVNCANPKRKIWLEEKYFFEVVNNLLSNAIKYSKPGGRVTVEAELAGEVWQMSVTDNGVGIPADDQKNVFSNFYRASNVMTGNPEGEGIGLYMVKLLIHNWGGKVWYESREGQGSTFFIRLPLQSSRYKK